MRILIVGTVPYNTKSTSRAFESYFSGMDKEDLAQIFSNAKTPVKGHCHTLYQITDHRMMKRWFSKNIKTGQVFQYDDLPTHWEDSQLEVNNKVAKLYQIGSKKNSVVYLLRKILWKKKYWCTKQLNNWLDEFSPECVFLSFSDDFFILEIALYVAKKYNIPIVSSIGDDYYFNYSFTLSPLYHIYKLLYRRKVRQVFKHNGSAIYIGNKIRDKYNKEFNLDGETVYLTSEISRGEFKPIDKENLRISYCGNIRLGRNSSLNDIGVALGKINSSYVLDIYSNENDETFYRLFDNNPNVKFHGAVPYSKVQEINRESDILIIAEGFQKKDVDISRYSLSTKVADSLASGSNILSYGSIECGAIEYMKMIDCGPVCTSKDELETMLRRLITDVKYQENNYVKSKKVFNMNHNIQSSTKIFRDIVTRVVEANNHVER